MTLSSCATHETTATTANPTHRTYSRNELNKTGQPDTAGAIEAVNSGRANYTLDQGGRVIALRLTLNDVSRIQNLECALSDRSSLFLHLLATATCAVRCVPRRR
jgi:hypothetical protein